MPKRIDPAGASAGLRPLAFSQPMYVTRPLIPPLEDFSARLAPVWGTAYLTNFGHQHRTLEQRLAAHLDMPHVALYPSGTAALVSALRVLDLQGSVVTTPFTFPATAHAITACGLQPVFCDIDPVTLTLDPDRLPDVVTADTSAVLGVHVFGQPCDTVAIEREASDRSMKVIYDGAHAFDTRIEGRPLAASGDCTMLSFHATKLFNTAEGGALVFDDPLLEQAFFLDRNFGILNEHEVICSGINGKLSELHAALGLANLDALGAEISARERVRRWYLDGLGAIDGISPVIPVHSVSDSLQYMAVLIDPDVFGASRDAVYDGLRGFNVFARKYFHPLCSEFPHYQHLPSAARDTLPVAHSIAQRILCLPFYGGLAEGEILTICRMLGWLSDTKGRR
jgi:dTDP-4-amino-4,6-dideoxygalactose transaminase